MTKRSWVRLLALTLALVAGHPHHAFAETGYDLWLRYARIQDDGLRASYRTAITSVIVQGSTPTAAVTRAELERGLRGLLGAAVPVADRVDADGALIVGTPGDSPIVAGLGLADTLAAQGDEGFLVRAMRVGDHRATVIASTGEAGALYGAFHFLRLMQTGQGIAAIDLVEKPRLKRRILNHWDNLDGTAERGYAGRSIFNWAELPGRVDARITDYARANASIGINGAVVNNVNANPQVLTHEYLVKAAALAGALRPYGIRLYLAANFAAPKMIGGLSTTDPLDPDVERWWREKADEIYQLIPDFGGFVVKANSEGQPGPQDYHRTHADGANALAAALMPHGGIVMWRAFVYDERVDADRVKRAYKEFVPLDGTFRPNVAIQVKNGPLDFQPREPFHPLYGALPKTPVFGELQITQEYLGQGTHLVYLAPMWTEFLHADTYADGPGSTVARVLDGSLEHYADTGIAGVANTGMDANWTGQDFGQANWYAFGRLAWNPDLTAAGIAEEWIRMTWSTSPEIVAAIRGIMLDSREAYVDYTMPLGLHHLIGGDHYAPMPENTDPRRADWSATFYHHADTGGIGFDRTPHGSDAVDQYRPPLNRWWADPSTTPDELLLWFHHLPWDYRLRSGRTLWEGLVRHYTRGAAEARGFVTRWKTVEGGIDAQRYAAVLARLEQQATDAGAWADKCLRYFQTFSHGPLPAPGGQAAQRP